MNVPNILTVVRIFLTFGFIWYFVQDGAMAAVMALIMFTLASVTDFLDGYLARKYDQITTFGKIMDPIVDKFLILSAFFLFMEINLVAAWMFVVILAREVIVTGLRFYAMGRGVALAAEAAGKLKTVLQIVMVYLIIIFIIVLRVNIGGAQSSDRLPHVFAAIDAGMFGVVIITLWSGLSFILNNRKEIFRVR